MPSQGFSISPQWAHARQADSTGLAQRGQTGLRLSPQNGQNACFGSAGFPHFEQAGGPADSGAGGGGVDPVDSAAKGGLVNSAPNGGLVVADVADAAAGPCAERPSFRTIK